MQALYRLALPSPLKGASSRRVLAEENARLRYIAELAGIELEKNYAQMQLMNRENTRLRAQIVAKKSKQKRSYTTNQARLLTGSEMVAALLHDHHVKSMKAMIKEMGPQFRAIKKVQDIFHTRECPNRCTQLLTKHKAVISGPANYGNPAGTEPKLVRGRGRGRGRARGSSRGRGRARGGRGQASDTADGSDAESEVPPPRGRGGNTPGRGRGHGRGRGRGGAGQGGRSELEDDEVSEDEKEDEEEPENSPVDSSSDSSDEESTRSGSCSPGVPLGVVDDAELREPEGDEIEILTFNGHRWEKGNVEFQVVWTDNDVTWEPLANVNDCAAMDVYLAHHSVSDPILLGKRKFILNKGLKASN